MPIRTDFEEPLRPLVSLLGQVEAQNKQAQSNKDPQAVAKALQTLDCVDAALLKVERFYRSFGATACVDPLTTFPSETPSAKPIAPCREVIPTA